MKKRVFLMAVFLVFSTVFSGCSLNEDGAKKLYKDSFAKTKEMKSYTMTATTTMEMFENTVLFTELRSAVMDSGATAAYDLYVNAMGMEQENHLYQQDGYLYSAVSEDGMYLKQRNEDNEIQIQGLTAFSSPAMSENYRKAVESGEDFTFEQQEDKSVQMSFDFSTESCGALKDSMVAILQETMLDGMDEQLNEQYAALGLSGSELDSLVEQILAAYREMYASLEVKNVHMKMTVDKDGFTTEQNIGMELVLNMSGLMETLGQDASAPELKQVQMLMNSSNVYENINANAAVKLPEFTEENTLTE